MLEKCFAKIEKSREKWLNGLDKHLPKQLAKVGQFLKDAKYELEYNANEEEKFEEDPEDAAESIHSLQSKIKSHNEVFENMNALIVTDEQNTKAIPTCQ